MRVPERLFKLEVLVVLQDFQVALNSAVQDCTGERKVDILRDSERQSG